MSKTNAEKASDLIWRHWQAGTVMDDLPPDLKPATRTDGYAIQFHLDGRSRQPLAGWKIAATNVAGQRHIGVDGPLAGRILAEHVYEPDAVVSIAANVTGYFCGIGASSAVKWLMSNEVDSAIRSNDLICARARVLLTVSDCGVGKVRLALKGQIIDVRATTEDGVEYPIGATVMAYDSRPDGELLVTLADEPTV